MNERILKALMSLFAIIAEIDEEGKATKVRSIVEIYLRQHLNKELTLEFLDIFDKELQRLHKRKQRNSKAKSAEKQLAVNSVRVLIIAQQLNEELVQKEKIIVILRLFDFFIDEDEITSDSLSFLDTLADVFNIPPGEYNNIKALCLDRVDEISNSKDLLTISPAKHGNAHHRKYIIIPTLNSEIYVLQLQSVDTYIFLYNGNDTLYLNGQVVSNMHVYLLENGAVLKSPKFPPIYHSDVKSKFISARHSSKIILVAHEIEFKFKDSENGIRPFSFTEKSGNLVGIMGGSGVGKSTLLNVLNGNLIPAAGHISINGYDLHKHKEMLKGVIGYVPQDDLLIEELTVLQNLYFNAKLCFAKQDETELMLLVNKILADLELTEIQKLKVGDPLNKFISGGQRKRLNIALELMREPSILIVDEPTSGLSSMDSEMVMNLLKEQAIKGKLVLVNIHQPSSGIFKMFDRLIVMDKGGYPVYYGNPVHSIVHFKRCSHIANAEESQCTRCGNVNPEQILEMVEAKVVNEHGRLTRSRKRSPKDWYLEYRKEYQLPLSQDETITELPQNNFSIPSRFNQFKVFLWRNILSKLTNKQYLLITFLEAPLLAFILGYFTKYIAGTADNPAAYIFSQNENLPAYIFMSVIVALFLGMTVSAEEIIRDRRILKRESFLNLSKISYYNSKVVIMFLISAVQMFSFVLIGNTILGIQGLTFDYWLMLFTTATFANMVGLNISSALNSVVNIYITIPFILVPQLLLSGVIVKFDKLHSSVNSYVYTPFVGDLMTSRWAYEGLAVNQFMQNKYERHFFWINQKQSEMEFQYVFLIPELERRLRFEANDDKYRLNLHLVRSELERFPRKINGIPEYDKLAKITLEDIDQRIIDDCGLYLESLKNLCRNQSRHLGEQKDSILNALANKYGGREGVIALKSSNWNEQISSSLRNESSVSKLIVEKKRLIQTKDPIYYVPDNEWGRAHFYAPVKKLGGVYFSTYWFNLIVIWLTTLIFYFGLITNGFTKGFSSLKALKIFK